MSAMSPPRPDSRPVLLMLLLFSAFLHLRMFSLPLVDADEQVYLYLSQAMGWNLSGYTTQGSPIGQALGFGIYNSPLFHHPPLLPFLIKAGSLFIDPFFAAKAINLALSLLSVAAVYAVAGRFGGRTAGIAAAGLWTVCPIFNLESSIIHLDFPLTAFLLCGVWLYLAYMDKGRKAWMLILSSLCFSAAMLCKYNGPVYVAVPFLLAVTDTELRSRKHHLALFFTALLPGFAWWAFVFLRFGTLLPPEFTKGDGSGETYSTPYLESMRLRQWYHVWLYFLFICPLVLAYLLDRAWALGFGVRKIQGFRLLPEPGSRTRPLAALSIGILACVAFSCWYQWPIRAFRHVMPLFPLVYIALGCFTTRRLESGSARSNGYLLGGLFITLAAMFGSTVMSLIIQPNLKPLPMLLLWIPQWQGVFH